MTFAVINWLSISINLLLVIFVVVCLLMTLVILMQRPKQEGLGAAFGGGVTDQVFGARTTNVLQKGTVYLASLFFVLSLLLAILIGQKNKTVSTLTAADTAAKVEAAKVEAPAEPVVEKSLLDELPVEAPATEAPAADAAPADAAPADAAVTPTEAAAPAAPTEASAPVEVPADDKKEP